MNQQLKDWQSSGEYISYSAHQHQVFVKQVGNPNASSDKTLLLLHGFPESSYSYNAVLQGLTQTFDRIILFDMIGYGWSDKPVETFSYSLLEQADIAFQVWKYFGITGGHILSHDMCVSVATEILTRHEHHLLPDWFSDGLKSVTFTNGSMILKFSKLRITQKILLSRYGALLGKVISYPLFSKQVKGAHGNSNLTNEAIQALWTANTYQDGTRKSYLTIKYLNDRKQFEQTRWMPALSQTQLPIHICWGEDDQVAQVIMAKYLKEKTCPHATLTIMENVGHFGQLGNPKKWLEAVALFYQSIILIPNEKTRE